MTSMSQACMAEMLARSITTSAPRSRMRVVTCLLIGAALAISPVETSVRAETPDYVGTWSADLANCRKPQESQSAPLVLKTGGYDQHETHCAFKSVTASGDGEWKISAECTVEGNAQSESFTITVSGDTLTLTNAAGSSDLLRCP